MKSLLTCFWGLCLLFLFAACWGNDEEYSTSPTERLAFSHDTLRFDTVITGQGTPTHVFRLYNRHDKTIRIARLHLAGGANSHFRVNVDGQILPPSGLTDLTLAPRDSMQFFVEMTAPRNGQTQAQRLDESLQFTLSTGVSQHLPLIAYGQDFEILAARTLHSDTTLTARLPYHVLDSLVVAEGATLRLAAGTRLYFQAGAQLIVRGRLLAEGTQAQPVLLRGDRLGEMFANQAYDSMPSQWGGLRFASSSVGNVLRYCDLHSADFGIRCEAATDRPQAERKLLLENSVLHNFAGDAFYAEACATEVGNTQISNAAGHCVQLVGGTHQFTHCTLAQFYVFTTQRGAALAFTNEAQGLPQPLQQATFRNCLITGYGTDDIMAKASSRYTDAAFVFAFQNCLLNTPRSTDEKVRNCLFEDDLPTGEQRENHFSPAFDLKKLHFSFRLSEKSAARGKADASISQNTYPTDPQGRLRLQNGTTDIGCYEAD